MLMKSQRSRTEAYAPSQSEGEDVFVSCWSAPLAASLPEDVHVTVVANNNSSHRVSWFNPQEDVKKQATIEDANKCDVQTHCGQESIEEYMSL
jgi:hypothetical protein